MTHVTKKAPLILTLALDQEMQGRLEAERRRFFPVARNRVPAHLTLFHHLPGEHLETIQGQVAALCAAHDQPVLRATRPLLLGRGVAYAFAAPDLSALHAHLAATWWEELTAQDQQPFRPHVTVQNKVTPEEARALYEALRAAFSPFEARGEGLTLWWYRGGPWEKAAQYSFQRARPGPGAR